MLWFKVACDNMKLSLKERHWIVLCGFLSCEWLVNDLLMFKVANLDFEWLYKTVELRMGIWVVTHEYERDVKVL